jgi:hypothetical protein
MDEEDLYEENNPLRIEQDEYSSFRKILYNIVLSDFVYDRNGIDRDALDLLIPELEWELYNEMSPQLEKAYQSLKIFSKALKESSDEELELFRPLVKAIFSQSIRCDIDGKKISKGEKGIYQKRDPCREAKYKLNSAIKIAEREKLDCKLLEASKKMYEVCDNCPYRE